MLLYALIIIGFIYIDQLTKWLAVTYLRGQPSFPLIKDVLHLTYLENRGAAFGLMQNYRWVFISVSVVAIIILSVFLFKRYKSLPPMAELSLSLIIAGGIGNMIDRIFLGYVVDFVDFTLINFAVFNAADACVSIGAVLLCVYVLFFSEKQDNGKAKEPLKATADKKNEKEKNEDDAAVIVTENINENIRSSAEEKSEPQNEEGEAN